jgi:hypothetical protein
VPSVCVFINFMHVVSQHDYYCSIFVAELLLVAVQSKVHKALRYSEQWDCVNPAGGLDVCPHFSVLCRWRKMYVGGQY